MLKTKLSMLLFNLILPIGFLYGVEADIDFKIHFCRFQCKNSCEAPKDESNPNGENKLPDAYYWRDFYGVIPPDAYPLGPPTQFPQTYIGMIFDPDNNGNFATTIYDGLDYTYNGKNGNATKISSHIQILCTASPESFGWFKLTQETYKTLSADGYKNIKAGVYLNSKGKTTTNFIVKTNQCHVTYIGGVSALNATMEFALIDGTYETSNDYLWLMYKPDKATEASKKNTSTSSNSFISHHYEFQIQPDSIMPKFYKKLTIGSCSITCTNQDDGNLAKIKKDPKLSSSMAYFWQDGGYVDPKLSIPSGKDFVGQRSYIGQALVPNQNVYDVGSGNNKSATINYLSSNVEESDYFHILGSNYQEKFQWVNTTTDDFDKLDKKILIPGGLFSNGSETYVCRTVDDRYGTMYAGSGRVFTSGTLCYSYFGAEEKFQVLMYQPKSE